MNPRLLIIHWTNFSFKVKQLKFVTKDTVYIILTVSNRKILNKKKNKKLKILSKNSLTSNHISEFGTV